MIVALDDKDPSQANNQKKNVKSTLMNKMEPSGLSKKEYLKKYLSGGDKKKKKKKTGQSLITKSKIVDDDIDLNSMQPLDDDELEIYDLAEEAPQIAGIIDERPDELRAMAEYRSSKKWKIVTDEFGIEDVKVTAIDRKTSEDGPPKREKELNIGQNSEKSRNSENNANRKAAIKEEEDWQVSPPKKVAIKQEVREDSDPSPPRRRQDNDSDLSPPRRGQDNDSDPSPPRRRREKDSDPSPPRRRREKDFNRSLSRRTEDNWRRQRDSDPSPPRRREGKRKRQDYTIYDSEPFPPKGLKLERNWDSPVSSPSPPPPRNTENFSTKSGRVSDKSEVNGKQRSRSKDKDEDKKVTNNRKDGEYGLKLSTNHSSDSKKEKKSSQLEKTLSGRKAGLQSADDMRKESESLRKKEKEIFEKMSDDVTGKHAKAIVRDRHTGRRHDAKEEARKKREQEEKEAARIAEYAVWGKGVKQVEDKQNKLQEDLYEMSKPLARYKDDKDLEEMLKNQERDGDPMLEYIRNKKKSDSKQSHRPEYEGSYMPNRYGIKPGHRWDGVDRSNGYEKKWFEEQNAKKAREEEAFKWSTEDM